VTLDNGSIAELLAGASEAETERPVRSRALRKAARAALMWPEEAAAVRESGRSLTELRRVGPTIARMIGAWLADPPDVPEPPRTRLGFITMASARAIIESNPGRRESLLGDLQTHTTYSDGSASIREMAEAMGALGHSYAAITDHSVGLPIAGGMDEATLARQGLELREVNRELAKEDGLQLVWAIEMNLSPAGEGDMEPDVLARLDLVLGAFHSKLRIVDDQTERYLAAIRNPDVHVIAHPRGRVFNTRPGLNADWPRVFAAAAEEGVALECDCYPDRQDLNIELLRAAGEAGCTISIGTDAHHPDELRFIEIGVAATIAAGIPPERILNFRPRPELLEWSRGEERSGRRPR
jgi:putative hydrolase